MHTEYKLTVNIPTTEFTIEDKDGSWNTNTTTQKTINYSEFVNRLAKPLNGKIEDILHAAVGIAGEAGELLDAVKKTWIYNKPLDRQNIVEELGDLNWYMQHMQNVLGISDEEIMEHNTSKLKIRYENGYSDKAAQERADKQKGQ